MKNPSLKVLLITLFITSGLTLAYRTQAVRANFQAATNDKKSQRLNQEKFGKLPLSFEANKGQADPKVKFVARGNGYGILLNNNSVNFRLRSNKEEVAYSDITLNFLKGNSSVKLSAENQIAGVSNYFLGNNKQNWQTKVPNFERVRYENIYRGIDLLYYGNQRRIEYDFVIAPHANPAQIALNFAGISAAKIEPNGDLILTTPQGELRQLKPQAYQEINGTRQSIAAEYVIDKKLNVSFRLGDYDKNYALIIDPVILNSTYLGGSGVDTGRAIAVGKDGGIYIFGETTSLDFLSASPIQSTKYTGTDTFVMKLNGAGTQLIYSTWLGGTSEDFARAIQIDDEGNAYVTGITNSTNFPLSSTAFQKTKDESSDGFITKINPTGTALVYSTLLGGNAGDSVNDIAIDLNGNAFIAGSTTSTNLPATGFQQSRKGNSMYRSANKASSWNVAGVGIAAATITSIVYDPVTPATVYATALQGLFKSVDGGTQWQQLRGLLIATNSITIDPKAQSTLYAATQLGVYKSTDSGATWAPKINGLTNFGNPNTASIVISPLSSQTLYCGTTTGPYKSTDGGETWVAITNGMVNPFVGNRIPSVVKIILDNTNPQTIYAATNLGFFKTIDSGANWIKAQTGLPTQGTDPNILNAYAVPSAPNTIYALQASSLGLYKTTDGGATWGFVTQGIPIDVAGQFFNFVMGTIALDPTSPSTIYATTTSNLGIFKSIDEGRNWTQQNSGLNNLTVNAIGVSAAGEVLIGTSGVNDMFVAKLNSTGSALAYLTYLGGEENDASSGIVVDKDGNAIVIGTSSSANYPTATPMQPTLGGQNDWVVTKLNPTGAGLIWSTFFGGRGSDIGVDIALGKSGSLYLGGYTTSTNMPVLNADFPNSRGGTDAFVAKLKGDGTAIEYGSYFGGLSTDQLFGLAIDTTENIYITGSTNSQDFPQVDPAQPLAPGQFTSNDIFVVKISPTKTVPGYSTLLGGNNPDFGFGIAVDALNQVYITGLTVSQNFPLVNAYQPQYRGSNEAFLMKLGIEADVSVAQAQLRNPIMINNEQTYLVVVTNNGPSTATGVKMKDVLPAGLTFVSVATSKGTCANTSGTINCDLGTMALNDKIFITIKAKPTAAGKITHAVSITSNDPDSTQANNSSTLETTVSTLPSIIGRVTDSTGAGVQGVRISISGGVTTTATTDETGLYQFNELALNGNYSLAASKTNFSFEPPFTAFTNLNADQTANFTATVCAYTLYPTSQDFMLAGGGNTISVLGTARCPWTATVSPESASWLKITSGATGIGNGTITYTVAPSTVPRSGFIRAANQTFIIFQHGDITCATPSFRERNYQLPVNGTPIHSTDINGDGNPDLVYFESEYSTVLNQYGRLLRFVYGDGTGNFTSTASLLLGLGNSNYQRLITDVDANNDKKKDLITFDESNGKVYAFLNDGTGKFTKKVSDISFYAANNSSIEIQSIDLNMDGFPDLIGGTYNGNPGLIISLNNGDGTFSPTFNAIFTSTSSVIAIGDFTGDTIPDVVVRGAAGNPGSLSVYLGDGIGSFGSPIITPDVFNQTLANFQNTVTGDFVSDGNLDLAFSVQRSDGTSFVTSAAVLPGNGNGSFGTPILSNISANPEFFRFLKTDFNGDARTDVIAVTSARAQFLTNDGSGKFTVASTFSSGANIINFADFNKDGKIDFFGTPNNFPSGVSVFLNGCGAPIVPTILGHVTSRSSNTNASNITMKLAGAKTATTKTDQWGNYEFTGLTKGANYSVTIEGAGLVSTPGIANIESLTDEQRADFSFEKTIAIVPATTYQKGTLAAGSLVSLFGGDLTDVTLAATSLPLPTELGGVSVLFNNVPAKLLFVSPTQINLQIPEDFLAGTAYVTVNSSRPTQQTIYGSVELVSFNPGLFTANSDGTGPPAATIIYVNGTKQTFDIAATCLPGQRCTSKPIDLKSADSTFLELYGSGMRNGVNLVTAEIAGLNAEVTYFGPHCCFVGVDQVNVKIPKLLIARGEVDLKLFVNGLPTNPIKIFLK